MGIGDAEGKEISLAFSQQNQSFSRSRPPVSAWLFVEAQKRCANAPPAATLPMPTDPGNLRPMQMMSRQIAAAFFLG
jgi:hypothetical protein